MNTRVQNTYCTDVHMRALELQQSSQAVVAPQQAPKLKLRRMAAGGEKRIRRTARLQRLNKQKLVPAHPKGDLQPP
eukprot:8031711-Alexandrium_andersonii.AAC.1